jgi:hypothetical protein
MNMHTRSHLRGYTPLAVAFAILLGGTISAVGQAPARPEGAVPNTADASLATDVGGAGVEPLSSVEQGQTHLNESFELDRRRWRLEKRRDAFRDTQFRFNLRSYYFGRENADGTEDESLAIGGWVGFKTGYFLDHISFAATGYTAQHLAGDEDEDGANLLAPGQEGYSVLGELYADIKIIEGLNLYVGRKEYDTPYINRHDNRMTPNTFEAIVLQGLAKLKDDATLKYGVGYFDKIKERNQDEFVSMAEDAGADADRGVYTAGAVYKDGDFSIGAIDYYSPDIINVAYAEAKLAVPITDKLKPAFALQFTDQRTVGDDLLEEGGFSVQQVGIQAELPVRNALFTAAFTHNTDGADVQTPWAGYPGYTSSQIEDFNRAGESALLLRAAYEFPWVEGLTAYAMWVHGSDPEGADEFAKDECNLNLEWVPVKEVLKGLSLRVRYGVVEQHGGDADRVKEVRVILNYGLSF